MNIFKGSGRNRLQQTEKLAEDERERNKRLARPLFRALGHQSPVAVVVLPGAQDKRKDLLSGLQSFYPENDVLILNARRVQRFDEEGQHVEKTLDELRKFRRGFEGSKTSGLVVFTGVKFPRHDTIDQIGRGTPEVIERVTNMINSNGPNDPRFLFIGDGTVRDMPTGGPSHGFPYGLDRGILDTIEVTYGLHPEHGLQTDVASAVNNSFFAVQPPQEGPRRFS